VDSLARALWVSRGMIALLSVAPAVMAAMLWAPATGLLFVVVVIQGVGVVWLRSYLEAVRAGDRGEILLVGGQRVPMALIDRYLKLEEAEHAAGALACLAVGVLAFDQPVAVGAAVVLLLVQLLMLAVRSVSWRQQRAYRALMDRRPAEALRILQRMRIKDGPVAMSVAVLRSSALSRLGEVAAAERTLADQWGGAYDACAALLAVLRLGRGDTDLARAWVEAHSPGEPTDRYQRYLRALVAGHLAVVEGTLPDRTDELARAAADVPRYQGRELDLLRAVGLHLAGRPADAQQVLSLVDHLDEEVWRVRVQPQLWAYVDQLRAGRAPVAVPRPRAVEGAPSGEASDAADPFAAPRDDAVPADPVVTARQIGAVPVEVAGLTGRRGAAITWVLRGLTALLLLLAMPLGLLFVPGFAEPDPQRDVAVGAALVAVLAVVVLVVVREGAMRATGRGGPGVVLADGRRLAEASRPYWWLFDAQSLFAVAVLSVLPVIELAATGTAMSGLLVVVLLLITSVGVRQHRRVRKACEAVHFLPPGQVVPEVERHLTHHGAGWMLLAYLVDGREADAADYLARHLALAPGLEELGLWVRAGRGAVDLDQLLQRPTPSLGSRYRLAVAQRLAALQAGVTHRLADDVTAGKVLADELPNRLGGLLHRLNHGVQAVTDPAAAARYATSHRHELRAGAWALATWPQLLRGIEGIDGTDAGPG